MNSKARLTFQWGIPTVISWSNYADMISKMYIAENTAGRGKITKVTYLD